MEKTLAGNATDNAVDWYITSNFIDKYQTIKITILQGGTTISFVQSTTTAWAAYSSVAISSGVTYNIRSLISQLGKKTYTGLYFTSNFIQSNPIVRVKIEFT